jgi:hypothetical protein
MQDNNLLQYDVTSLTFICTATQSIENKYSFTNDILEIDSSSCHVAGNLLCTYLLKMLLEIYNVKPILPNDNMCNIESVSSKRRFSFILIKF